MPRATNASGSTPARPSGGERAAKKAATAKKAAPAKKAATKVAATAAPVKKAAPAKKAPAAKKAAPAKKAPAAKKAAPAKKAPARPSGGERAGKKAPATPGEAPTPYDAKFLEAQRQLLLSERQRLTHDVDTLVAEADELAMMREPGDVQFDEESGEGDTLAVERERDLALSAQFRSQIEDIDHALGKVERGTYGVCEVSGQPIPKERLKAIPWARERVEYKVGGFGRR